MIFILYTTEKLGELFHFEKKSKIKAGNGLDNGKYKFFTSSPIQNKFLNEYLFDNESLIFGTGGQPSIHYCNEKFATSTDCFVITPKSDKLLTKYVYFFFLNNMDVLERGFKGAGLKHISKKYLQNIEITFPIDISVQRNSIKKLTTIEEMLNLKNQSINLMDEYIKNKFYFLFGDIYRNPNNWEFKSLKELGEIQTGNTPPRKDPENYGDYIEWMKSGNINTPYIYLTKSKESLSEKGYSVGRIVPKNSILVTCIAGSIKSIGNVAIANREVAFNQQINSLTPNEEINEIYLYHLILYSKRYVQSFAKQSLKYILNKTTFSKIPIICPPIELQNEFADFVTQIETIKLNQFKSKEAIIELFNITLKKSFKGMIQC